MLRLGQFEVDDTHAVEVDAPTCEVRIELTDPRTGEVAAVEGAKVCLLAADGTPASAEGTTDRDGEVSLIITNGEPGAVLQVEVRGRTLFDFDAMETVIDDEVETPELRPLIRLPEVWRSDGQSTLHDDLGGTVVDGRLPSLEASGVGTVEAPWVVRLDHDWTSVDVVFEFYDTQECELSAVEQGLMVEAFEGTSFSPNTRVGGGTVTGDDGQHFVRLFRDVAPGSLHIRAVAPGGTFLELTDRSTPLRRWRTREPGTVTPLGQRLERYEVPTLWCSRGQYASLDGGATARPFGEVAADVLTGGKTVHFDLDDVLLVDDKFRPVNIRSAIPVTVFGGDFVVKRPSADEPQHSDVTIDRAHLRGRDALHFDMEGDDGAPSPHALTRVIRRGRRFYDLDGSRTTEGEVVGVRRAVRDAHPVVRRPKNSVKGAFKIQVDFHLFDRVGTVDVDGSELSTRVALAYGAVRLHERLGVDASNNELEVVRRAFKEAAARWTGEELGVALAGGAATGRAVYLLEDAPSRATKLVFHFPTVPQGRSALTAHLVRRGPGFRAHAVGGSITLDLAGDFPTSPDSIVSTEDGIEFTDHTVAHEVGHVLGLPDEYLEKNKLDVPQFIQPFRSLVHVGGTGSLMNGGYMPMLRDYWVLGRALAQAGHLAQDTRVCCDTRRAGGASGRFHRYRPEVVNSPYEPITTFSVGPEHGGFEATLGELGDDFDLALPGGIDAVLNLSPRLYLRPRGRGGSLESKTRALKDLAESVDSRIAKAAVVLRRVSGDGGAGTPQRVLVEMVPRFSRANVAAADLRVHLALGTAADDGPAFAVRRDRVTLHAGQGGALLRHLLDLPVEQVPRLKMKGEGATLTFTVGARVAVFEATADAPPGRDEYVSRVHDPKTGLRPLEGSEVAVNLAAAINDPANSLHPEVSAVAEGDEVRLVYAPDLAVDVKSNSSSRVVAHGRFRQDVAAEELDGLARALSDALGVKYEVEL